MGSCFCTGACIGLGYCPNLSSSVVPYRTVPPEPSPTAPPPIVIQVGKTHKVDDQPLKEEDIRRIVREELRRFKQGF